MCLSAPTPQIRVDYAADNVRTDHSEHGSTDLSHTIAEVQQTDCQSTQDDRKVQPREERSVVRAMRGKMSSSVSAFVSCYIA